MPDTTAKAMTEPTEVPREERPKVQRRERESLW